MSLEQLYQQVILDHAKTRHGAGEVLGGPEPGRGVSHQLNPVCGDEITMQAELAGGRIRLAWSGAGCSISMASASALSELVADDEPEQADRLIAGFRELMDSRGAGEPDEDLLGDAAAFHGVSRYPARIKCALLSWTAFEDALRQVRGEEEEE